MLVTDNEGMGDECCMDVWPVPLTGCRAGGCKC